MAIIKAPPKQPKSVTIQARVEESIKAQLDQYADPVLRHYRSAQSPIQAGR